MSGLEELGIPGPVHVREALSNCTDETFAAIEEFQLQNGILLPSLRPALPLLDLHGLLRLDFHQSILEELKEKMLQRIREIANGNDKNKHKLLTELLVKCFPVIKVKLLRPVVMCLMQHLPKIKQEYLNLIMSNRELYKEAAVEVRQQIWQDNQALFGDEVSPLLSRYIDLKESALFNLEAQTPIFFLCSPKSRRQETVVQELAKMVGKNVRLYDMVLQFLRTLFLRTRNVHYCTLRAELLMILHDSDVQDIISMDPCHKFTWCLDACVRERFVDLKRAKELHAFLDTMRWNQEQVLGDLSMILCDPQSIQTISSSLLKSLQNCVNSETLPRNSEDVLLLLRMLSMGLRAWQMIDSQIFKEPKLDTDLVIKFLPGIIGIMVEDQLASLSLKAVELDPVHNYVIKTSKADNIAATVVVHYALTVTKQGCVASVIRILPLLAKCDVDTVYSDLSLHELVSYLANMADSFSSQDLCCAVFDKFFMPYLSRENVIRHLLRLLRWIYQKVDGFTVNRVIKSLKSYIPTNGPLQKTFQLVSEKINSIQPSPVLQSVDKLETPLLSTVPHTILSSFTHPL